MVGEQFFTEEETLRKLKINKAQLEEFIRQGKLTPIYQEGIRKFRQSDISQIAEKPVSESVPPPPEPAPPAEKPTPPPPSEPIPPPSTEVPPPPKAAPPPTPPSAKEKRRVSPPPSVEKKPTPPRVEGSTRVIEPPKETPEISVRRKAKAQKEAFLKSPAERMTEAQVSATMRVWIPILLIVAFLISAFSITTLYYNLTGKKLPALISKAPSALSGFPVGTEEIKQIQEEADSVIEDAEKIKEDAQTLIEETERFIQR
ncbi:MAG TPA: hypothetical protein EYP78_07010 [Candidatus Omnitrophica bacterium]|nr:hypothetical protein [Candidatus Omnitrophota bacterium]